MLIPLQDQRRPLTVFGYDVACPKRARWVREAVFPHACMRQLSVIETRLPPVAALDLFAELSLLVDPATDRVAMWRPRGGLRLAVQPGAAVMATRPDGHALLDAAGLRRALAGAGNAVISYDVSDPADGLRLHARVLAGGAMVQRSVYLWRADAESVARFAEEAADGLKPGDRLWIHPLAAARDLWRAGGNASCLLPVATHHWPVRPASIPPEGDEHGTDGDGD
jgi:CRISPR/Cas system-associated endoribonuclease Cas2